MEPPFRGLVAYRAAAALGDELYRRIETWPSFARWSVGLQLARAVDSIAANIAEATGRWQPDDKKRLLVIARGSLRETEHWIERAVERGLLEATPTEQLAEISRNLSGLINAQRRR
jgi:four helix bundle protein